VADDRTARWRKITLVSLFTGYAGYYLCRSNLSVVTPLILKEYAAAAITKTDVGFIASVGILLYSLGKVTNGVLTDFFDGRRLFLGGMAASIVCTVLFGLASGLAVFGVIWAVNRYVQSVGWGALVKISSRWYPVSVHATVMGVLSMSYLLGDALGRLYLGVFIKWEFSWREVFFVSAATLSAILVAGWFTLKGSPQQVGAQEPPADPQNVFGTEGNAPRPENLSRLLGPLLVNPMFWLACLMNVGLTLIRETFNFWTPTYLTEAAGMTAGDAAQSSMFFPLVGAASALAAGALSDRFKGKHGRVAFPALLLLIGALVLLGVVPTAGRPWLAVLLICAVSFFLMAPYSFCSGVIALSLGGKRGSSTAAGLIDGAGYLGAVLSGWGIGSLAQRYGWPVAFMVLAGVAALTALATAVYWVRQEFRPGPRDSFSSAQEPVMSEPVERIFALFRERGDAAYIGEPVSQTEHALQTALAAERAGAGSPLIAAALLHDIGHLLHHLPEDCAEHGVDDGHEGLAARWLARFFGPEVTEPIRLHVPAKRYLCTTEWGYAARLSQASALSLKLQGGPYTPDEAERFRRDAHAQAALLLRRWDEAAKLPDLKTPDLEHFRPHLEAALVRRRD
jgi:OPA family glycerol-3-phosphate transporter-like MFS transporter